MPSLIDLIDTLDSYEHTSNVYTFVSHDGVSIGYILPYIAEEFKNHSETVTVDENLKTVKINEVLSTFELRNDLFAKILSQWKDELKYESLKGWRNELYTIYNPTHTPYMLIERAFSALLGVITYGVHINGFIPPEHSEDGQLKVWVPRRSYKKPTCPGQLDNTVAGGIGYPYLQYETCLKECYEEAGLQESYTRLNLKACGVVSYIYQKVSDLKSEEAVIQPEVEFIYDLTFDKDTIPKPVDGEVHEFYLLSLPEVLEKLKNGEFKYNCAGVIIDFLIRYGHIDSENEKEYLKIYNKLHRSLPFPTV